MAAECPTHPLKAGPLLLNDSFDDGIGREHAASCRVHSFLAELSLGPRVAHRLLVGIHSNATSTKRRSVGFPPGSGARRTDCHRPGRLLYGGASGGSTSTI